MQSMEEQVLTKLALNDGGTDMNRRQFLQAGAMVGSGLLARRSLYAYAQSPPLRKFIQALPGLGPSGIPVASPNASSYPGYDYYRITMGEYTAQLHPDLPKATTLWGYADATDPSLAPVFRPLGPVIVASSTLTGGRPIRVTYSNNLPPVHPLPVDITLPGAAAAQNRAVVHLHGGHVPWTSDGGPYAWFTPANGPVGPDWVAGDVIYPNDQRATLLWYHDHAMGTTRLNAYAGLASALILRDAFELALIGSGAIPSREIPLIIQDKTFKSIPDQWGLPGDLWYPSIYEPDRWELESDGLPPPVPSAVPEFFGDTILVNGVVYPFLDVEPRRYRFRVLNGSNARFYTLKLVYAKSSTFPGSTEPDVTKLGPPFLEIGTEGGFLPSPVLLNYRPNAPHAFAGASGTRRSDRRFFAGSTGFPAHPLQRCSGAVSRPRRAGRLLSGQPEEPHAIHARLRAEHQNTHAIPGGISGWSAGRTSPRPDAAGDPPPFGKFGNNGQKSDAERGFRLLWAPGPEAGHQRQAIWRNVRQELHGPCHGDPESGGHGSLADLQSDC